MAGQIKGITIQFNGDTTKLDKALRDINKSTKSLDKELGQIDKALKFNPTNVDLWRQKQEVLNQKVAETKNKLDILKQAQKQLDAEGVDETSEDYRNLQRQIIVTENQVKNFEGQLKKVGNVKLKALSAQFEQVGKKIEGVGNSLRGVSMAAAGVVAGLGATAYKAGTMADELNTLSKVTGIGTGELQKYAYASNLVDVSVEAIAQSNKRLVRSAYQAAQGSKTQAEAFNALGVSVTDSNGNLRNSEAIFQDVIAALGQMTNETERDALAQTLMGRSAAELNPLIEDGGETYKRVAETLSKYDLEYIDQDTIDKANEFNDQLDTMKLLGSVAFAEVGSQLAAYLVPALVKAVDVAGKFANWLAGLDPAVLAIVGSIAAFVATLAPVLIFLGKLAFGISQIISLVSTIGPAIGALAGPVGIAIAAIAAAIAIGVALYKNWDKIKAFAVTVKDAVINAFTAMKNGIVSAFTAIGNILKTAAVTWFNIITWPYRKAWEIIKAIANKIKNVFNFNFKLPKIKLPHFSIRPKGWKFSDLLEGSIPSLGIDWYKDGAIFTRPTIIGNKGFAEAGAEAALPLEVLWKEMDGMFIRMADSIVNGIGQNMAIQAAGQGGTIVVENYLYPSGPKMGEVTVETYDKWKKILG